MKSCLISLGSHKGPNNYSQKEEIEKGNKVELSEGAAALTAIPQAALDAIADRLLIRGFLSPLVSGGGLFTRGVKGAAGGRSVAASKHRLVCKEHRASLDKECTAEGVVGHRGGIENGCRRERHVAARAEQRDERARQRAGRVRRRWSAPEGVASRGDRHPAGRLAATHRCR